MSLSRLALRLAAVEALNPSSATPSGPWPTDAGPRVYDSRIDPLAHAATVDAFSAAVAALESKPIVTLYTEEHETAVIQPAEYPAEVELVDLVAQIQIGARGEIDVAAADGTITTYGASSQPATDGDAEAILDMIEGQLRLILDPARMTPTNALFRAVATERHHIASVPERSADRATRLAMRTLKIKLRVKRTTWRDYVRGSEPDGLDILPEPLRTVALGLAPASVAARRCEKLAASIRSPIVLTPLKDVRMNASLSRGAAPTRPDGLDADAVADVPLSGV